MTAPSGIGGGFGRSTFVGPGADIGRATIIIDGDSSPFLRELLRLRGSALLGLSGLGEAALSTAKIITTAGALATAGIVGASISAFASFEDAFAGVAKTVEATGPELDKIREGLRDLAKQIPVDVATLSDIARLAGQFGIAASDIVEFTSVIALMSATIDDLPVDQAAESLARLVTILQLPNTQFKNLASTLTDLGNKFASSEASILKLTARIAGAGKVVGITASQLLGIGNAFAVVVGPEGLEAAGTAVQKVLLAMNKAFLEGGEKLELFAETAGLSVEEFKTLFERDAQEAFTRFVEGLGKQGREAGLTLLELELGDARLVRSFLQVAGAGDLLRRSIDTANKAFLENIALDVEAAKRFDTLSSKVQLFKNRVRDLGIELGEMLKPALVAAMERLGTALGNLNTILAPGFEALSGVMPELIEGVVGLLNGVANLAVAFLRLFAAVGEEGVPALGRLAEGLGKFLNQIATLLAPAFSELGNVISELVTLSENIFGDIAKDLNDAFSSISSGLVSVLRDVNAAFTESLPTIGPLIVEMANAFADFTKSAGPQFANFLVQLVERLAQVATAVFNLLEVVGGPALQIFGELFNQIGNIVIEVSRVINQEAGDAFQNLANAISGLLQRAGPALTGLLTEVVRAFVAASPAITTFINTISNLIPILASALTPIIKALPGLFTTFSDTIVKVAPALGDFLTRLGTDLAPLLGTLGTVISILGNALVQVLPSLNLLLNVVADLISTIAPTVFQALTDAIVILAPSVVSLAQAISGGLTTAITALAPFITTLATSLGPLFTTIGTIVGILGDTLAKILPSINQLADAFIRLVSAVAPEVFQLLADTLVQLFVQATPAMVSFLDAITKAAPGILESLGPVLDQLPVLVTTVLEALTPLIPIFGQIVQVAAQFLGPALSALGSLISVLAEPLGKLLEALLPVAKILGDALLTVLVQLQPILPDIVDAFTAMVLALTPAFVNILDDLGQAFIKLLPVITPDLIDIFSAFVKVLEILAGIIEGMRPEDLRTIVIALLAFKGLKALAEPIGAFGKSLFGLKEGWEVVKGLFGKKDAVAAVGKPLFDFGGNIKKIKPGLLDGFKGFASQFKTTFTNLFGSGGKSILPLQRDPLGRFLPAEKTVRGTVRKFFDGFADLPGTFDKLKGTIGTKLDETKGIFDKLFGKGGEKIFPQPRDIDGKFLEFDTTTRGVVRRFFDGFKDIPNKAGGIVTKIKGVFTDIGSNLTRQSSEIFSRASGALKTGFEKLFGKGGPVLDAAGKKLVSRNILGQFEAIPAKIPGVFRPIIDKVKGGLDDVIKAIGGKGGKMGTALGDLTSKFGTFAKDAGTKITGLITSLTGAGGLSSTFGVLAAAIAGAAIGTAIDRHITTPLSKAAEEGNKLAGIVEGATPTVGPLAFLGRLSGGDSFRDALDPAGRAFRELKETFDKTAESGRLTEDQVETLRDALNDLGPVNEDLKNRVTDSWATIQDAIRRGADVKAVFDAIKNGMTDVELRAELHAGKFGGTLGKLPPIIAKTKEGINSELDKTKVESGGLIDDIAGGFVGTFETMGGKIVDVFFGLKDGAEKGMLKVIEFGRGIKGTIIGLFEGAVDWLYESGIKIIDGLKAGWNFALDIAKRVGGFLSGVKDGIVNFFSDAGGWLYDTGRQIVAGLLRGILDIIRRGIPFGVGEQIADFLEGEINKVFQISSPSKRMMRLGENIGAGLLEGIFDSIEAARSQLPSQMERLFEILEQALGPEKADRFRAAFTNLFNLPEAFAAIGIPAVPTPPTPFIPTFAGQPVTNFSPLPGTGKVVNIAEMNNIVNAAEDVDATIFKMSTEIAQKVI